MGIVCLNQRRVVPIVVAGLVMFFSLVMVAMSTWWVMQPSLTTIVVPGAREIRLIPAGLGEWQVTYRTADAHYHWYVIVLRQLDAEGWMLRDRWRPEDAVTSYNPVAPVRLDRLVWGVLREEVLLDPELNDPRLARIRVQRGIDLTSFIHRCSTSSISPSLSGTRC